MPVAKPTLAARLTLCLVALLLGTASAQANELTVSNISLTGQDTDNNFILVQFDITWKNSWRVTGDPNNWDAVWVFVKYRVDGGPWMHATLNTTGHTAVSGSTIDTPTDGTGVFIYRSADGTGTFTLMGVQLRWNYGIDGLDDNESNVEVRVLGIEMVYVPQGIFELGSGGTETDHFYKHDGTGAPDKTQTYTVSSEGSITVGTISGNLYYDNTQGDNDQMGPIPATFPKGFAAFYIQKYEISQGQYAEFLNLLLSTQAATRFPDEDSNDRHTISSDGGSPATYSASVPDRACNHLNWADMTAYADWAGLRPMTELEFEKASRGTLAPVADEYAWGNTSIHASPYSITSDGTPTATINNAGSGTGNASYDPTDVIIDGPIRVGIFAASFGTPSRQEAGATFYGAMEMSGNLWEQAVTIGNSTGRAFTGAHGDGVLAANGDADATDWPGANAVGAGFRGGSYLNIPLWLKISDRDAGVLGVSTRNRGYGGRVVRSAP